MNRVKWLDSFYNNIDMKKILIAAITLSTNLYCFAANDTTVVDSFKFEITKQLPITPVKNQANTGTCWSFSTIGFFESEILRIKKQEVDLSEMFVVHHSYQDKAEKYARMNGTINFEQGGSFEDVSYAYRNYGIVPESVMNGLNYGEKKHQHSEMTGMLKSMMEVVVKNPNKSLSTAWKKCIEGVLNAYLGEIPSEFEFEGKKYTPKTYAESLGLNMEDYYSITSFTHHPFYSKFAIEIPDNWRWAESWNVPMEDLERIINYGLEKGYTFAWGADVSEKGFTRNGIAVNPEVNLDKLPGSDQSKWTGLSEKEMLEKIYKLNGPQPEVKVSQELRQKDFDNYKTTDDHGMVIYGTAKDQNGTRYYLVKNSWGTDSKYKGIWYASKSFVMHKTINILIHKDAIPTDILKKLK